jgi:hypothetical protein
MQQINWLVNNFQLKLVQVVAVVAIMYGSIQLDSVRRLHGCMDLYMDG